MSEIKLNPEENLKDREIADLSDQTTGIEDTIQALSKEYGRVQRKLWDKIRENYPEIDNGSHWGINRRRLIISETNKDQ